MTLLERLAGSGHGEWSLRAVDRDAFRRWVVVGSVVTALGYAVVLAANLVLLPERTYALVSQAATVVVAVVSTVLAVRGRLQVAVMLLASAVWLELHSSIPFEGLQASTLPVFPLLVMAVGFPLGGRGSFAAAGLTTLSLATVVLFAHGVVGLPAPEPIWTAYLLLVTSACMFVAAAFVHVGVATLGRIVGAARASEARVMDILAHSPDGIVALDAAGKITALNPAAERALGSRAEVILGRELRAVLGERVREADHPRLDEPISGRPGATETFRLELPGGEEPVWMEVFSRAVRREDGSEGVQVSLRDVSERRHARVREDALRGQLEHAQRLEAVGRLAGGVAHDFNNLLTVVGGSAELLRMHADEDARRLVDEILRAKERGADLVRRLLAFGRKEVIRPRWLDVGELVAETHILLTRIISEDVELVVEVDSGVPAIWADAGQVEQVIVNLVSNARDAMGAGGAIRVEVAGPGTTVRWRDVDVMEVPGDTLALAVKDEGEGMPPEVQERIFEPFFTTKPRGAGTGLGLSTVHGILNQNGGSVVVTSEPDVGTCIVTLWPTGDGTSRKRVSGAEGADPGASHQDAAD